MGLTYCIAEECGGSHNKQPRSTWADSSSDEPVQILRREGMVRVRAALELLDSMLDAIDVPCRVTTDNYDHGEANFAVAEMYVGVEHHENAIASTFCLARDAARERPLQVDFVIKMT